MAQPLLGATATTPIPEMQAVNPSGAQMVAAITANPIDPPSLPLTTATTLPGTAMPFQTTSVIGSSLISPETAALMQAHIDRLVQQNAQLLAQQNGYAEEKKAQLQNYINEIDSSLPTVREEIGVNYDRCAQRLKELDKGTLQEIEAHMPILQTVAAFSAKLKRAYEDGSDEKLQAMHSANQKLARRQDELLEKNMKLERRSEELCALLDARQQAVEALSNRNETLSIQKETLSNKHNVLLQAAGRYDFNKKENREHRSEPSAKSILSEFEVDGTQSKYSEIQNRIQDPLVSTIDNKSGKHKVHAPQPGSLEWLTGEVLKRGGTASTRIYRSSTGHPILGGYGDATSGAGPSGLSSDVTPDLVAAISAARSSH